MLTLRLTCLTLTASVVIGNALLPSHLMSSDQWKRFMIRGRPWHGLMPPLNLTAEQKTNAAIVPGTFQHKVDHTDASNHATFQQRYWYNSELYRPGGPVLIWIGGETPASGNYLYPRTGYQFSNIAQQQNAFMFVLEHRFYGPSQPFSDLSTANLRFLSSSQALEDLAAFIQAMNRQFNLSGAKWITVGGSYPANLAAWMRELHPDLVTGALASSGPVMAKVDFFEYLEVVQDALAGNSAQCAQSLADGMQEIAQQMTTGAGRNTLKDLFNVCYTILPNNANDVIQFYEGIIGPYQYVVQYSGVNDGGKLKNNLTVPKICQFLEDTSQSVLRRMQNVDQYIKRLNQDTSCLNNHRDALIQSMQQTAVDSNVASSRAWTWQTCTEFGYLMSTDSPRNFFGQLIGVDYYIQECIDIFGSTITSSSINNAVDQTNAMYGGRDNFKGTNIAFTNGNIDPWHALGMQSGPDSTVTVVLVPGTAHCADMLPPADDDVPELTAARALAERQVAAFLA